ncbi:hypothetical protein T10_12266 [Trichinella papuae]|uniref:Uncharacterized protein n=1 Tax=Trichinella papuae TaxID=268474 RepID=A0A0V1M3W1_9BILA|nr:hypothetical protein T10_12266 [Trichinella papuae]
MKETDIDHPTHLIMQDAYLKTYALWYTRACDVWISFPDQLRDYIGLIADRRIIVMMGGQASRRLTYIAIEVAQKKEPSLAHLRHIASHHRRNRIGALANTTLSEKNSREIYELQKNSANEKNGRRSSRKRTF